MAATDRIPPDATPADLGEFGLVEVLASRFAQSGNVILGPGDDAAVVSVPDEMSLELRFPGGQWQRPNPVPNRARPRSQV